MNNELWLDDVWMDRGYCEMGNEWIDGVVSRDKKWVDGRWWLIEVRMGQGWGVTGDQIDESMTGQMNCDSVVKNPPANARV